MLRKNRGSRDRKIARQRHASPVKPTSFRSGSFTRQILRIAESSTRSSSFDETNSEPSHTMLEQIANRGCSRPNVVCMAHGFELFIRMQDESDIATTWHVTGGIAWRRCHVGLDSVPWVLWGLLSSVDLLDQRICCVCKVIGTK